VDKNNFPPAKTKLPSKPKTNGKPAGGNSAPFPPADNSAPVPGADVPAIGMTSADPKIDKQLRGLLGHAETSGYKPVNFQYFLRPRDLPPFTFNVIEAMQFEPTIKLGLAARAAPLCTPEFAYKQGEKWIPGVQAENEVIAAFVERQLMKIWNQIDVLLDAQKWGWAAAEVTYELTHFGTVEIKDLHARHARDVRVIKHEGQPAGVRFLSIKDTDQGHVDSFFPDCIFHNHATGPGEDYGTSILIGAYSPWADKWLSGGALDVRRLFMHKDAYGGVDLAYPEGTMTIGDRETPNRDVAREIVEQLQAGGVTTRPSRIDPATGKQVWELTRATVPANPAHILQYPKDLDGEMLRGLEVPDDVLSADNSGAWAGKQVPMAAFYCSLDRWLNSLVRDVVRQLLVRLVRMNFGTGRWFEVSTKPLAVQAMEQMSKSGSPKPEGGGGGKFQPNFDDGMGDASQGNDRDDDDDELLDDGTDMERAVGMGLLQASKVVRAASRVVRMGEHFKQAKRQEIFGRGMGGNLPGSEGAPGGERAGQADGANGVSESADDRESKK